MKSHLIKDFIQSCIANHKNSPIQIIEQAQLEIEKQSDLIIKYRNAVGFKNALEGLVVQLGGVKEEKVKPPASYYGLFEELDVLYQEKIKYIIDLIEEKKQFTSDQLFTGFSDRGRQMLLHSIVWLLNNKGLVRDDQTKFYSQGPEWTNLNSKINLLQNSELQPDLPKDLEVNMDTN